MNGGGVLEARRSRGTNRGRTARPSPARSVFWRAQLPAHAAPGRPLLPAPVVAALASCCIIAALAPAVAMAQPASGSAPPSVEATLDPSTATVGDRLTLRLRVERDTDTSIEGPDVRDSVAPLAVLDTAGAPPREEDGRVVEDVYYILAAFETGALGVPQLPFAYRTAAGESGIVWTDSLTVVIESVIPDTIDEAETGPRDIKPPIELPRRVWPILLAATLVGAAVAALYFLRRWWQTRKRVANEEVPQEPAVPRRAAHLYALERLRRLEEDDPVSRGDIIGFYVRVTEIVRLYIRDRFGVDAIDMTTAELRPAMERARMEDAEIEWSIGFLSHADLAKFAKYLPDAERARSDLDEARAFVERTRLLGEDPEEEAGQAPEEEAGLAPEGQAGQAPEGQAGSEPKEGP